MVAGIQQSSNLRIEGSASELETDTYILEGTYTAPADPYTAKPQDVGSATLTFTSAKQTTRDVFAIVRAGSDDRFWFMSTKPEVLGSDGAFHHTQDIVSGEAVRAS